jgi:hypothetical protein
MRKKLTIEYIRSEFEKEGYTLLSEEYVNKVKLNYRCDKGHEHSINWHNWQHRKRCPICYGKNIKLTIEFISGMLEKENYILLTKKYVNSRIKLDYVCSNGHEHSIKWNHWQRGDRCPYCSGNAKLTLDEIKFSFENAGYTLLSTEYINSKTKLDYRCPKGHEHSMTWGNWYTGNRCYTCFGSLKPTIEQVRNSFDSEGYILLSKEYVNAHIKLSYQCSKGHEHSITWMDWRRDHRCPTCSGLTKPSFEQVVKSFEYKGFILLSKEYVNNRAKLDYICSEGHEHSTVWKNWIKGHGCPTCANINNSGSNNLAWKGGISCNPYCPVWKDKEYKQDIRNRDGNRCLNPYCSKKNFKLHIHHIDYNKKNCHPSNLITVCNSCNSAANKDRDWHTTWYQAIIKNRYGGVKNAYIND